MNKRYFRTFATFSLATLAGGVLALSVSQTATSEPGVKKSCSDAVTVFLTAPTDHNYAEIKRVKSDECRSTLTDSQLQSLDKLIAAGNESAAQLMAGHVRKLDGGELEDALRSFGQFSSHNMRNFMTLAAAGGLTEREVSEALTMLPLEFDDDFNAQLSELRARRTAIGNLHEPRFESLAKTAANAIDTFMAQVDRARIDQQSRNRPRP